jgi:hypothetical protein
MRSKSSEKAESVDKSTSSPNDSVHVKELFNKFEGLDGIRIIRRPHPPIIVNEMTDEEVRQLREGASDSIYFTVALGSCLAAVSIIASLLFRHPSFLLGFAMFLLGVGILSGIVWLKGSSARRTQNPNKK